MQRNPSIFPGKDTPTFPPPAFNVMLKPRGAICNLDCQYCYYLAKERLYPGSRFRMADDLLEQYTRQYVEAQRVPEVTFVWQGGEPTLMGLPFFERVVELQKQYGKGGQQVGNALQTNGFLIDADWARFLGEYKFLVGLSLDGPREVHERYRPKSFHKVMRAARLLREHAVAHSVLCCLTDANIGMGAALYRYWMEIISGPPIGLPRQMASF